MYVLWCLHDCPFVVRCCERELKVVKMMSVKGGLLDLSNSMSTLAKKMLTVSEAQQVRVWCFAKLLSLLLWKPFG